MSAEQHLDEKESAATLEDLLRSLVDHTLLRLSPDRHRTLVPKGGIPVSFGFDESGLFRTKMVLVNFGWFKDV